MTRHSDTVGRSGTVVATDNNEYRCGRRTADGAPLLKRFAHALRDHCWIVVNGKHHGAFEALWTCD